MNAALLLSRARALSPVGSCSPTRMRSGGRRSPSASRGPRASAGRVASRGLGLETPSWLYGGRPPVRARPARRAYAGRSPLPRPQGARGARGAAGRAAALCGRERTPASAAVLLLLAVAGFVPDLMLRSEVKRRREAIFLDLPEAIAVLALSLGAGQSLRQALELAARDCPGALGEELPARFARPPRALARRAGSAGHGCPGGGRADLRALLRAARGQGEPLPLPAPAGSTARAEQNHYLERAADRPLSHARRSRRCWPCSVLLLAYGFLRFLAQTV